MTSVGRDLRRISEAFARSAERAEVRQRAFQVRHKWFADNWMTTRNLFQINIRDLTNDEFNYLLSELFLNGNITRERIVVLFFFCSDLAISAVTNGPIAYFKRLIHWSLTYIFNNICQWVQRQGGWVCVANCLTVCYYITVRFFRKWFWALTYRDWPSLPALSWDASLSQFILEETFEFNFRKFLLFYTKMYYSLQFIIFI